MISKRAGAIAAVLILLAHALPALAQGEEKPASPELPDTWFATSVATVGSRVQFTNFWSKGDRFRAETIIAGHRVVSLVDGETYYSVDDVLAAGVAISRDAEAKAVDEKRDRPFGDEWAQLVRAGGESVGFESVNGRQCEVFRLTNSTGRRTVWVSTEEPRVPVRVVTFDRITGLEETVDYVNWMRGLVIADAFFEPPEQTELMTLDYATYRRMLRQGPVGPVPVLYPGFLESEWSE